MVYCSVKGCKSRSEYKVPNISFHTFPKNPELCRQWVSFTKRVNWIPKYHNHICSLHFPETSLLKKPKTVYLKSTAVPISKKQLEDTLASAAAENRLTKENKTHPDTMKSIYVWCAADDCTNNTMKSIPKVFINIPSDPELSNIWLRLMNKDHLSTPNKNIYLCEDHFDLPNDMLNYAEYCLKGTVSQVLMRPGCVPTKFGNAATNNSSTNIITEYLELKKKISQALMDCLFIQTFDGTTDYLNLSTEKTDIKSLSMGLVRENKLDPNVWKKITKTEPTLYNLWSHVKSLVHYKLQILYNSGDKIENISPGKVMTINDWLLYDLVLVHENSNITEYEIRQPLLDLFYLVKKYDVENLSGTRLVEAWSKLTNSYNSMGKISSPMLLQKRWFDLKEQTRKVFHSYWDKYKGKMDSIDLANEFRPPKLMKEVAKRFPSIIIYPFQPWDQLVSRKLVITTDNFNQSTISNDAHTEATVTTYRHQGIKIIEVNKNIPHSNINKNIDTDFDISTEPETIIPDIVYGGDDSDTDTCPSDWEENDFEEPIDNENLPKINGVFGNVDMANPSLSINNDYINKYIKELEQECKEEVNLAYPDYEDIKDGIIEFEEQNRLPVKENNNSQNPSHPNTIEVTGKRKRKKNPKYDWPETNKIVQPSIRSKNTKVNQKDATSLNLDHNYNKKRIYDVFKTVNIKNVNSNKINLTKSEIVRWPISSKLFKKPRKRLYDKKNLKRNPDFNIELMRLKPSFWDSRRNFNLFRACVPLTIDLSKAFESKLIRGRMYLTDTSKYITTLIPNSLDIETENLASNNLHRKCLKIDRNTPKLGRSVLIQRKHSDFHINSSNVDQMLVVMDEDSQSEPYFKNFKNARTESLPRVFCCWSRLRIYSIVFNKKYLYFEHKCKAYACKCCCKKELMRLAQKLTVNQGVQIEKEVNTVSISHNIETADIMQNDLNKHTSSLANDFHIKTKSNNLFISPIFTKYTIQRTDIQKGNNNKDIPEKSLHKISVALNDDILSKQINDCSDLEDIPCYIIEKPK